MGISIRKTGKPTEIRNGRRPNEIPERIFTILQDLD
jgi:hypothetical protein